MRPPLGHRLIARFEVVVIAALQILLMVAVVAATVQLFILLFKRLPMNWNEIQTAEDLHPLMQRVFGGVLIVVLGLELIETLKVYFKEGRAKVLIGVCRGRKLHDKRDVLKKKDVQRDIERAMRRR